MKQSYHKPNIWGYSLRVSNHRELSQEHGCGDTAILSPCLESSFSVKIKKIKIAIHRLRSSFTKCILFTSGQSLKYFVISPFAHHFETKMAFISQPSPSIANPINSKILGWLSSFHIFTSRVSCWKGASEGSS